MKDQLNRYLHPTADMKKAIERNAKQDEDLSLALKQIDREKRMAFDLLSRKQDDFKKQILKRRETLANNFRVQLFDQGNTTVRNRLRPQEMEQVNRVRRTMSCEETRHPSMVHKLIRKRHSLPASAFSNRDGDGQHLTTGSEVTSTLSAIRRHSAATFEDGSNMNNNVRLLQRRRATMHTFVKSGIEHEIQTLIRL